MSDSKERYWNRYVGADGRWRTDPRTGLALRPPGEDLAALRSGLGQEAGTVPKLWPHYTCEIDDWRARRGEVSDEQRAEHAALALFGLHQQSQDKPMHRPGVPLGKALRALRQSEKFSEQAVDARVAAAATATAVPALLMRLRGLIDQLRTIAQPLDYDRLLQDIDGWQRPDSRQRVRRSWALGYQPWVPQKAPDQAQQTTGS
jgi:CRISPR system Cascade subunit CasB